MPEPPFKSYVIVKLSINEHAVDVVVVTPSFLPVVVYPVLHVHVVDVLLSEVMLFVGQTVHVFVYAGAETLVKYEFSTHPDIVHSFDTVPLVEFQEGFVQDFTFVAFPQVVEHVVAASVLNTVPEPAVVVPD